jgi:formiminoglutamate deiminase
VTQYWCEWAWLGDEHVDAGVLLDVDSGAFTAVESGVAACPAGATRRTGVTLPGLVDAHSHAFHRALRGRTHGDGGDFWTWREAMFRAASALDPDSYRELATAVFAEAVLAGTTSIAEFHYLHHRPDGKPYAEPNAMALALVDAARAAGVRLVLLDTCYLRAGFDEGPLDPVQERFSDGDVDAWIVRHDALTRGCADAEHVVVGAAAHSVRAVPEDALAAMAAWHGMAGGPLHVHVSEQLAENEACAVATGRTPAQLLADTGVLTPDTTAVHATHVDSADIALLARFGGAVCLCPTTERDLADGIGPARELAAARVPLCIGADSRAVVDLFEEARAVELDERLRSRKRGAFAPADLLQAMTAAGAAALHVPGGALRTGAVADFVTIGVDSVRLAGFSPERGAAHIVFAATAADVTDVVVAGQPVVEAGEHLTMPDAAARLTLALRFVGS